MSNAQPRVPAPSAVDFFGVERHIQMNHCREPSCPNFGVPARYEHGRPGPSADRDMRYKVHSTKKGQVPSIRCTSCRDNPPMKSNAAIAAEIGRLIECGGFRSPEETLACRNVECANQSKPIAANPREYRRRRVAPNGGGRYYQCRECGRKMLASDPDRLHRANRELAADVFSRIANKSPVRGVGRGARLGSVSSYYEILDFIHRRCRRHSGTMDRALMDGALRLPNPPVCGKRRPGIHDQLGVAP